MQEIDIQDLLKKHLDGTISPDEKELLENWYLQWEIEPQLLTEERMAEITSKIYSRLPKPHRTFHLWPRIAAAAVILIAVGAGIMFYLNNQKPPANIESVYANDIAPGEFGATLTLANGKKIRLADAANGEIAKEAGISVSKTADGQLVYHVRENAGESGKINTLTTAKGETYILTLPDKSTVWLNAASSLTYSATLNERGVRRVKLEGEAYFQIARDKAHPFIVESKGQQVEVLGTHFNVSAYEDDADVRTTLLEGSVRVNENTILKPGQQSVCYDKKIRIQQVNTEDVIAWKNGLFVFEDEPLQNVMRKVARWYNVEIIYKQNVNRNELYWGSVSRYDKVSKVLEGLELTKGIHFKIEGRRITVMQ